MRTPVIVCLLFVFIFLISVENSFACTCVEDKSNSHNQKVRDAYKNSTAIFAGKVVGIDKTSHPLVAFITIQVVDAWKGVVPTTITIVTNKGENACEYPFVLNSDYLIYTVFDGSMLSTNYCLRTAPLAGNPDIEVLNKITKRSP